MIDALAEQARPSELIGDSPVMRKLLRRIPVAARARRTTLISGPTGSGKEVVAAMLHSAAGREDAPYVAVHCGALPENLVESELFGHTRGAFTGATQARPGLVRSASGGTLFLDEIDSLSPAVQAKLLRFLETGEYRAVGSDRTELARVWVLAATNCDLAERVNDGRFRADLLYRLDVMRLDLPPLRMREGDVELLARVFLQRVTAGRKRLSPAAIAALYEHDWPGNVRELKHRVERAALLAEGGTLEPTDLELDKPTAMPVASRPRSTHDELWGLIADEGLSLAQALARCERVLIEAALRAERDNRTRAAQRLGIHVRTIFKKLHR